MSDKNLAQLFRDLKEASSECWKAKIAENEVAGKHATLCLEILQKLGYVPRLLNCRIEERKWAMDGMDVMQYDFWCDANMIIALNEHFEEYMLSDLTNVEHL